MERDSMVASISSRGMETDTVVVLIAIRSL